MPARPQANVFFLAKHELTLTVRQFIKHLLCSLLYIARRDGINVVCQQRHLVLGTGHYGRPFLDARQIIELKELNRRSKRHLTPTLAELLNCVDETRVDTDRRVVEFPDLDSSPFVLSFNNLTYSVNHHPGTTIHSSFYLTPVPRPFARLTRWCSEENVRIIVESLGFDGCGGPVGGGRGQIGEERGKIGWPDLSRSELWLLIELTMIDRFVVCIKILYLVDLRIV